MFSARALVARTVAMATPPPSSSSASRAASRLGSLARQTAAAPSRGLGSSHSAKGRDGGEGTAVSSSTSSSSSSPSSSSSSSSASAPGPAPAANSAPRQPSFIDRAKAYGAQALVGRLVTSERFDSTLEGLVVKDVNLTEGTVTCELLVTRAVSNTYGTLHGGAIATIVDLVGTMALLTRDPLRAGVSVDLNVSYLAAAKEGETVTIVGKALKVGKKLGFSEVVLRRGKVGEEGPVLATGRHTKAL